MNILLDNKYGFMKILSDEIIDIYLELSTMSDIFNFDIKALENFEELGNLLYNLEKQINICRCDLQASRSAN